MEWSFTSCPLAFLEHITSFCDATVAQHPEIVIVSPVVATGVDSGVSASKGEGKGDTVAPKAKAKPKASV